LPWEPEQEFPNTPQWEPKEEEVVPRSDKRPLEGKNKGVRKKRKVSKTISVEKPSILEEGLEN